MTLFRKLIHRWQSLRYYVIADPTDNSITLSKHLFDHIRKGVGNDTSVFVFRIPQNNTYGFMLGHGIIGPTQLCQIQYNNKYRCVGFETLCPSVGHIFYHYGLPALRPVKLSVSVRRTLTGKTYYELDLPTPKQPRLCKASSATRAKRT